MTASFALTVTSTLFVIVGTWLLCKYLFNGIATRYGLAVGRLRPTSVSDIKYRPLESPTRNNSSPKRAAFSLAGFHIDSIWLEFHRPSDQLRSWISLRVAGPVVVLEHTRSASGGSKQKRAMHTKGLVIRLLLDKLGRILRNGSIRILFHLLDVRVDALQVLIIDGPDGRIALRYAQDSLALTLHSKLETETSPALGTHGKKGKGKIKRPNVRIELTISPCEITAPSVDSESPAQLFVLDSPSTITFCAHATVLGSVEVPGLDVRINGLSMACSEIMRIGKMFRSVERSLDKGTVASDKPSLGSTGSSSPRGKDSDTSDADALLFLELQLALLQDKLLELSHIRPTLDVTVTRTSISLDYTSRNNPLFETDRSNRPPPTALITFDEVSLRLNTTPPSTGQLGSLDPKFMVKGIFVDLCHLPFSEHSTYQVFSATGISFDVSVPVASAKQQLGSKSKGLGPCALQVRVKLDLEMPRFIISDHLIAYLVDEKRIHDKIVEHKAHKEEILPRSLRLAKIKRQHTLADCILRMYQPAVDVRIVDPTLIVQIIGYELEGPEHDGAFLIASMEQVAFSGMTTPRTMSDSDLMAPVALVDYLIVCETNLSMQALQVCGARGAVEDVARSLPDRFDVLVAVEYLSVTAQIAPPITPTTDTFVAHLNINCNVGQTSVDFSRLPKSQHVDYFQLMARISSLRRRPRKAGKPWVVNDDPVFVFTSYLQVATGLVGILLVGEDLKKALFFEVQSLMWANSAYFGNPTTNGGQDPSSLLRSSRLEVNDISLRTLGAFEPVGDYATMKEQFFTTSPHIDICLQSRRVQLYTAGDEDAAAEETNTSHHPIPTITTDEVVFNVSVRAFYVALKATLYFVKLVKLFKVEPKHETAPVVSDEGHAATVLAQVTVDRLIVYLVLPEEVPLRISLDGLDFRLDASRGAQVATDTITVEVSSNDDNTVDNSEYATLVELEDATVDIRNGIDGDVKPHKIVSLGIADIRVFVPHAFKVSNVIENAINMQKAIKELCRIELGTRASSSTSSRGRTRINPGAIPTVRVAIDNFTMQLEDDPFESILSRNYHLGMEEQEGRLARDKAFQNKAAALRAIEEKRFGSIVMGARQSPEVENAWWMLQEFDSRAWIDRMRKTKAHAPSGFPALLNARFANLTVVLTRPVLPAETVEESLNVMDPTTPPDALYAELIPRNINVSLAQLSMQIRDYAYPLVYIPSKWTTEGLIILAEQALQPESQRTVLMPLDLPDRDHIVVSRAVNPTKLYTSFNTTITSDTTTQVCWGASTEPGIADMMGVFDTFTRPNVDPSVPIGWWDKLRLIMHGHNAIHITGGGDVKFRILGSSSPYFDGRKHWGTEGMTISLKDGVRIDVNGSSVPGEDVTIEAGELALSLPSMKPQQHASNAEDTITCFKGGVKISLGFDFFTQRSERKSVAMALEKEGSTLGNRKNHAELCLRAPEFCSVDELKRWDSFRGFRTHSIHVTINIESPRPFYASLPEPLNSLSLTMETLSRFFTFTQVYQSPLTSLPIRRGKLFQEAGPGPSKQKLGRVISSIRLITCIYPLLAGFVAEPRERNWGVGMRIRAEQMNMDMTLVQRVIRQRRPKEELLKRKSATKWLLSTSEIELKEVEARAIAYGNIDEAKRENEGNAAAAAAKDQDGAGPGHGHPTADDLEDHDWYFASDYSRSTEEGAECNINMVPFAWAPRIIYFKRNEVNTSLAHDNIRARRDIYSVQKTLFKSRMREIESSIRHYLDVQKGLEYRMAVFFDDSLRQQSQIIVEKMAVLHEKKVVIDKYIRGCQKKMDSAAHLDLTGTGRAEAKLPPSALFKHHFIVHNVNLLWKKDVRNILFQMISLQQRRLAIKYCLSNTATRVMSQLVASVAERRVGIDPMMDFDPDRPPEPSKAAHHHSSPTPVINKSSTMEVVNMTPTGAHRLLSKLVDEMTSSFMVPNEMDVEEETASTGVGRDSTADYNSSDHKTTTFASSKKAYVASRDPESPDYVADNQTFESEYIVQLIHPQVNLEAESKDDPAHLESVVVAAESMQLRSVLILDARASSSQAPADENSDRNEEIIKSRMILNIEDAQLFVARLVDFVTAPEFDLDNIVMHRQQGHDFHNNNSTSTTSTPWPVWVPIECLIDHSSHSGHLQRVVERTSASFYRDLPNPLYLKGDNAMNDPESMQQLHMNFPNFAISANATQYMVIYDVIENLLVYRDPVKGEHAEKLKKMLLVLEQMEDLRKVQETVIALQQKIRNADAFLRCGNVLDGPTAAAAAAGSASASTSSPPTHSDEVIAARKLEIMRHLAQYQDELIIIINALKAMQMLEQKKNSAAVSLQTSLRVDKLVWCMIHDDNNPLCEWVLDKAQFSWTQHEDQSSINTLHIDQLHLENHLQAHNSFKEVIAPYTPDKRDVDFTRHKMIRVYLREMAPVAGIKVVDHFEVNIFPLLIQVTYDMVKEIIYYLFPEKKAGAKEHSSNSGASGTGSGSISHVNSASSSSATAAGSYAGIEPKRFPRSDSVDQLTVRSAKSSHSEPSATAIMLRRQSSVSLEVADNVSISATSSRASSVSEGDGSSPLLDRKRIFKTSAFSAYGHQRTGSSRSENNKEDDHDTVTSASTTGGPSTANAGNSNNNPSPKLARAAAARKITKVNELKQMQARASSNRSFIYIKMPGGQHCLSYRGSKEKNIEDLFMFAFKMPTLEFRNKTWTWLDFLDAVKKEALRAVLANTGALVREKLFQKRKPEQQQIQNQQANETAPATGGMLAPRLLPHPGPTASTATITTSTTTTSSASFSSASASAPATQTRQSKFNRSMFGKRSSSKDPSEREREKDKDKDKDRDKDINSNSNNDKPISYSSAATSKKDHHHHQYPHQVVPLQPLHEEDKKMNQRRKEKGQQAVHQPSTELLFDLGDEDG